MYRDFNVTLHWHIRSEWFCPFYFQSLVLTWLCLLGFLGFFFLFSFPAQLNPFLQVIRRKPRVYVTWLLWGFLYWHKVIKMCRRGHVNSVTKFSSSSVLGICFSSIHPGIGTCMPMSSLIQSLRNQGLGGVEQGVSMRRRWAALWAPLHQHCAQTLNRLHPHYWHLFNQLVRQSLTFYLRLALYFKF